MKRLNFREIEQELEESISDGETLTGSRSHTKIVVRAPYSSRRRNHATEGRRGGSGSWEKAEEEGAF